MVAWGLSLFRKDHDSPMTMTVVQPPYHLHVQYGHNQGPPLVDDGAAYARDSLDTLGKKLRESVAALKDAKAAFRYRTITTGQILVAARIKFGLVEGRKGVTNADRQQIAKFKAWCVAHSGLTYTTCKGYMSHARHPDRFERDLAKQHERQARERRARGAPERGSSEYRVMRTMQIIRKLPDAYIEDVISRCQEELQRRAMRDQGAKVS